MIVRKNQNSITYKIDKYLHQLAPHIREREAAILLEGALEKLEQIEIWIDAYPVAIFPEPDFKKAAKVLRENELTLDAISASNMRHVLNGIKSILDA